MCRRATAACSWLVAGLFLVIAVACSSPREATLVVLHTNDVHAHLERRDGSLGAAEVAGAIEKERREEHEVLVLDAGDLVAGTAISNLTGGRAPFAVTALMGYDAMALGNHELDHGWRRVAEFRAIAPYPILCANAFAPDGTLLADAAYEIFHRGPLRVAVIGALTGRTLEITVRTGNEGVVVRPPGPVIAPIVARLRPDVDLVVLLSHCGLEEDRRLAEEVPGIDLIVGGHSHSLLEAPERVGDTWIVQAGSKLRNLGRVFVVVDLARDRVASVEAEVTQPDRPVHPEVAAAVQDVERDLAPRLDRVLGEVDETISSRRIQAAVEGVYRRRLGADLAFHNPGGVRAEIPAGPVTVRRLWEALPFDNTIVRLRIPGRDLPEALRGRLSDPIEEDRLYTLATNSYVAQQQARYLGRIGFEVEDSGIAAREAFIEAFVESGGLPSP